MSWTERDGCLIREWRTPDFLTAHALVNAMVGPAEALGHHPDITFGWGYVRVVLTTHDAGGLTELDRRLAGAIDEVLKHLDL
jgi:4a-hydroxytetrahydrobiopterin dehydratase